MCDSGVFTEVEYFNINESKCLLFFDRFKLTDVRNTPCKYINVCLDFTKAYSYFGLSTDHELNGTSVSLGV